MYIIVFDHRSDGEALFVGPFPDPESADAHVQTLVAKGSDEAPFIAFWTVGKLVAPS